MPDVHLKEIILHQASRVLEVVDSGGKHARLSAEFLRVHSPSAQVQRYGNPILQTGKKNVAITRVEPVGRYGIKLVFDDGHDTGLFSWRYLIHLCSNHESLWQQYLDALNTKGESRSADESAVRWVNNQTP